MSSVSGRGNADEGRCFLRNKQRGSLHECKGNRLLPFGKHINSFTLPVPCSVIKGAINQMVSLWLRRVNAPLAEDCVLYCREITETPSQSHFSSRRTPLPPQREERRRERRKRGKEKRRGWLSCCHLLICFFWNEFLHTTLFTAPPTPWPLDPQTNTHK